MRRVPEVLEMFGLVEGEPFNIFAFEKGLQTLKEKYGELGNLSAQIANEASPSRPPPPLQSRRVRRPGRLLQARGVSNVRTRRNDLLASFLPISPRPIRPSALR